MVLLSPKNSPGLLAALTIALSTMTVSSALTQAVAAPLKTTTEKNLGTFLVDSKGMTLYIFDDDKEPEKSACYGGCAETWPPFSPKAGEPPPVPPLSIIKRDDGRQYAYAGKPLYYYAFDAGPGDTEGHGLGNRWWVAKP